MLVHHVSIFPEAVVFDMEQAVFYAPVSSPPLKETVRTDCSQRTGRFGQPDHL